jgi:hypothetical protein
MAILDTTFRAEVAAADFTRLLLKYPVGVEQVSQGEWLFAAL